MMNASNNTPITVQGVALEEMDSFTYLGSILATREERMQMSEPEARAAFHQLKNILGSSEIGIPTLRKPASKTTRQLGTAGDTRPEKRRLEEAGWRPDGITCKDEMR
ncbi:hypothetical protein DPMN_031292 [Dreissena polymorpha]|uniref:Uncharacterized protein n=1 Tax=Dreissena polymorpha TaxID=45954 RepID=A0A9D4M2T1_DREPO|nr:hypothetical protein DPMN_031292 [Dreissena polymorpha]